METIRKPSTSAFIAVDLNETLVEPQTAELIVNGLSNAGRHLGKIASIGLHGACKRVVDLALKKAGQPFCCKFFTDCEKGKEWVIVGGGRFHRQHEKKNNNL